MHTGTVDERLARLRYADLAEQQPEETKSRIERLGPEHGLSISQFKFHNDGVLVLEGFFKDSSELDRYREFRELLPKDRSARDNYWGGWSFPTPFMLFSEMRDLALHPRLMNVLQTLIGEPMALNLALTGFVSTSRNFHQDTILNPRQLGSRYLAVWVALDDIHPDSGVFQFIPGSHRWPTMMQSRLFSHLTPQEQASPHWPTFTQDQIARMCEEEIHDRGARVVDFVPKKSDLLIWHSNLIHRGSEPKDKSLLRKAFIGHYSGIPTRTRIDMPNTCMHTNGEAYFNLPTNGSVRPDGET